MVAARIVGDAFAEGGASHGFHALPGVAPAEGDCTPAPANLIGALDASLSNDEHLDLYARGLFLPWRRAGDELIVANAGKGGAAEKHYGATARCAPMPKQQFVDALQQRFRARLAHDAEFGLDEVHPAASARRVVTRVQRWILLALAAAIVVGGVGAPEATGAAAFVALAMLYSANIVFRVVLYVTGWSGRNVHRADPVDLGGLDETGLPIYTLLVPLYREANMMGRISRALAKIDYPPDKTDIKLIFEERDAETIAAARALRLDARFEILVVPDSDLHTKPRACNYALRFARGEFVVIYDAEDRPDPDQLKKAVLAFQAAPDVSCFQARLAFYNAEQNWLSSGLMAQR